jgi:hypothetical protein
VNACGLGSATDHPAQNLSDDSQGDYTRCVPCVVLFFSFPWQRGRSNFGGWIRCCTCAGRILVDLGPDPYWYDVYTVMLSGPVDRGQALSPQ